ncbi:hypothetical protein ACIOVF_02860 [Pseudomonas sp. NPDC087612]|uniref:hypothetical protein n=1 Tax=Pseudomonas sp. NPDC087612 TaxID=3364441 RepID=UPI0038218AC0
MKQHQIPPHPVLTLEHIQQLEFDPVITITSSRGSPGARGQWGGQFTLGHDSDWDPVRDELEVICHIEDLPNVWLLFGPAGVAPKSSTLALALEWVSSDSGWRTLGEPVMLRLPNSSDEAVPAHLTLELPANTARGTGTLSLQLFLSDAGTPDEEEKGLARIPGFRFGLLGPETRLIIDGDGSLFPVIEEELGVNEPLWRFTHDWSDPGEDEFSTTWLSLSLNNKHPDFPLLREKNSEVWTPLFCQVMASWLATFLLELQADLGVDFSAIALGRSMAAERGSIVDAAASMVKRGNLNCSSPGELIRSIQAWVDTIARTPREVQ